MLRYEAPDNRIATFMLRPKPQCSSQTQYSYAVVELEKHYSGLRMERIIDWLRQFLDRIRRFLCEELNPFYA